jgi:hypothetical protein
MATYIGLDPDATVVAIFVEKTMDPITTAIVAALPALGSDLTKSSVKDALRGAEGDYPPEVGRYEPRGKISRCSGGEPEIEREAEVLAEPVNATGDAEVIQVLAKLVDQLKKEGIGGAAVAQIAVNISGGEVHGIIGAQNVSIPSAYMGGQCSPIVGELPAGHAKIPF